MMMFENTIKGIHSQNNKVELLIEDEQNIILEMPGAPPGSSLRYNSIDEGPGWIITAENADLRDLIQYCIKKSDKRKIMRMILEEV
jgi:hypothetical protein